MRKGMKKVLALSLATTMAMTVLSGCGGDPGSQSQDNPDGGGKESGNDVAGGSTQGGETQGTGDWHDELPEDFAITIMLNDFEGSPNSGEYGEQILNMIEEHTGYQVEIQWVTSDNYDDKLSTVLAGGVDGMPMILSVNASKGLVVNSAHSGAFWPIEGLVDNAQDYPNLSQYDPAMAQAFVVDGHLYGMYMNSDKVGRFGLSYRTDWAENLGLAAPKTVDDVYNMLYQFTYGDPDGNGKDDTYGLNLCKYTGPLDVMQVWFGVGNKWVENEAGELVPVHMTQEYMEALNWFKKLYDDGLIAKDWAIRDTGSWKDDNYNSVAGAYCDCIDDGRRIWDYFTQNDIKSVTHPEETATMSFAPSISLDGTNARALATSLTGFFAITRAAKSEAEVRACLEFLDKMSDDEMLMLVMYGLEGIHWELDENGEVVQINKEDKALHKGYSGLNQMTPYMPNANPTNYVFHRTEADRAMTDAFAETAGIVVPNPALGYLGNSATYAANGGNLDLILDDARTQYIVGDIDQAGLQAAWDQWLASGGQQVMDEVNEQHKANK